MIAISLLSAGTHRRLRRGLLLKVGSVYLCSITEVVVPDLDVQIITFTSIC